MYGELERDTFEINKLFKSPVPSGAGYWQDPVIESITSSETSMDKIFGSGTYRNYVWGTGLVNDNASNSKKRSLVFMYKNNDWSAGGCT